MATRKASAWILVFVSASLAHAENPEPITESKATVVEATDIDSPRPEFPPLSPMESLKLAHLGDGFEMELMAAEPMVIDPVAIEWGPDGKLWVAEMADYPLGRDGKMKPGGRIRYLEDTDRDGDYDKSTLFMTGVNFPTGVLPWRSGVVVTAAPEIFYVADTNGDGIADLRETLYRGFVEGNTQLRVNGLQWGLDGWVYCANGWSGGVVRGVKSGAEVPISGRDFRIRLEENRVDAQSGMSEFGRNRDDWGNWFGCDNSHPLFHFMLPDHYIRRNPRFAPSETKVQVIVPEAPTIFGLSPPERRFHTFDHVNRFTSACSAIIYRDDLLFGNDGRRHAFVCEPVHNLVHHEVLSPRGGTFTAARPAEEETSEFLASEDRWFRPVQVRTGPDGALWVVDMYRYIVEHPEWLPPEGKAAVKPFERLGDDRGRLYRIYPKGQRRRPIARLSRMKTAALVAALDSSSGWQRDTAQQMLVQRRDDRAIAPLREMAMSSPNALARLHAMWTLDLLGQLDANVLIRALADPEAGVRVNALRIAESRDEDTVIEAASKLVSDREPHVRFQLAFTLGAWSSADAATALGTLLAGHHDEPHLVEAAMTSLHSDNIAGVIEAAISARVRDLPHGLLTQAVALGRLDCVATLLKAQLTDEEGGNLVATARLLAEALDALEHRGVSPERVFDSIDDPGPLRELVARRIEQAAETAFDNDAADDIRAAAVALTARGDGADEQLRQLAELLSPQTAPELQQAVVARLASTKSPRSGALLLAGWKGHTPGLRATIVEALLRVPEWTAALLDAIEQQVVHPADLGSASRQRLATHKDPSLRNRAERLLSTSGDPSRQQVLATYKSALDLSGDAARGAELFKAKCAACHRLGELGNEVGPNLASLTDRSPHALLTAILDPSQAVEARFLNFIAVTSDGRTVSGMVQSETGTSVTLIGENGQRFTVLRADLESIESTGKSMMPDGLEKDLTPQNVADIMQHIVAPPTAPATR
jgi:putative membrane-bound dehydrogenase-like protein